jgi:hypothetical protein
MSDATEWLAANQRHLSAAMALVRNAVERHMGATPSVEDDELHRTMSEAAESMEAAPAIDDLAARFGLSPFERDVVLLCAACELDGSFAALLARARGAPHVTFGVALAALTNAHWSALAPTAPLRAWQLVHLPENDALTSAPLRIDERVLHFLTGINFLDERCRPHVSPVPPAALSDAQLETASRIARTLAAADPSHPLPRIELTGSDAGGKRGIARAVCELLQVPLYGAEAAELPMSLSDRESFSRLWQREALLAGAALLIDVEDASPEQRRNAIALADRLATLVFVRAREPQRVWRGNVLRVEVNKPGIAEQRELWRRALERHVPALNGELDILASHFDLGASTIANAAYQVLAWKKDDEPLAQQLWDSCRAEARPRLDDLARRVIPVATWGDLVLPQQQLDTLREIASQTARRAQVYEQWGFGARGMRGLGISALFAGPSGTGKTLAAEVLANELRLDLYTIDLSAVVSKYIGQTEENLRKVFDAAEEGGAVLLFDEADALFGKRTEVKDSHDRYANIEVSYLLQRMEAYRGLVILTTNMRGALDNAFLRRLRFIITFPFPDPQQRAEIWRRAFPKQVPLQDVDPEKLARLNVAGGHIRNIAINAAFLAAAAGEPVRMLHLLSAARSECGKIERPLTDAETAGWT